MGGPAQGAGAVTLAEDIRAGSVEPAVAHALARLVVGGDLKALGMCLIPMKQTLESLTLPTAAHTGNRAGPRIIFEPLTLLSGKYPDARRGVIWFLAQGDPSDLPSLHPQIFQPLAAYFGMPGEQG